MCSCVTSNDASPRLMMHHSKARCNNNILISGGFKFFKLFSIKNLQLKNLRQAGHVSHTKLLDESYTQKLTCPLSDPVLRSGKRRSWHCGPCSCRRCQWRRWLTRTAAHRGSRSHQSASAAQPLPPRSCAGGATQQKQRASVWTGQKVRRTLLTKHHFSASL